MTRETWTRVAVVVGLSIAVTVVFAFVSSPDPLRLTGATAAIVVTYWMATDLRPLVRARSWIPLVRPGRSGSSADLRVITLAHEMTTPRDGAESSQVRAALAVLADDRLLARGVDPGSEAAAELLGPRLSAYVRGTDAPRGSSRLATLSDFVDRIEEL